MFDPLAPAITGLLKLEAAHHRMQADAARFPPVRWYHLFRARYFEEAAKPRT